MGKMRRLLKLSWNWFRFILKGIAVLPAYYRYWGFPLGTKRLIRASVLPGLNQLLVEINDFQTTEKSTVVPKRHPDYVVIAPDFASFSAGNICLYQLCADLRALGFEAVITGSQRGNPKFSIPLISTRAARDAARRGAWVIYPEIVTGNPLRAKNVVRWALNKPGLLGGEAVYPESEHVFIYSDVYAPYVKNKIRGKLYMPTIDRSLFYPPARDAERGMICYYTGKSRYKPGWVDPKVALEITRSTPPKSELGKIFRASKFLYCFDNSTALIYEALLCGCRVVVIPDGTQTWADYQTLELGTDGISWDKHPETSEPFYPQDLQNRLNEWERQYHEQLHFLVSYTQEISPSLHLDVKLDLKSKPLLEQKTTRAAELTT